MVATAILDFQNFNFSTIRAVKRVELHHCARFCRNRFNRGRDIAIFFDFSRWRPPPCWILKISNFNGRKVKRSKCISVLNFIEIARTAAEICEFQYYASLAWKCLFTPLFEVFGAHFPPNDGTHRPNPQKDHPWMNHVIWAINSEYFPIDFWMGLTRVLYFPLV